MRSLTPFVATFFGLSATLFAQRPPCERLTVAEIEAVAGEKPATASPSEMELPATAGKAQTMKMCFWPITLQKAQVVLSVATAPPGITIQQYFSSNTGTNDLKKAGYAEEKKAFGADESCAAYAPPAGLKDGMNMTTCAALAKGNIHSLVYMSPARTLSIDQVKGLLDRVLAR